MPNILCIETSIGKCSVSLKHGESQDYIEADKKFMQSELLLPLMQQLLKRNNIDYKDLDILACSLGPGSFTGIRIGIAAARGIKKIFPNIELLGVATLELMISELQFPVTQKKILAVLNASAGDLYAGEFDSYGIVLKVMHSLPQASLESKDESTLLVTEETSFQHSGSFSINLTAKTLLNKIEKIISEKKQDDYKNIWPLYVREPSVTTK
jgi:tRNA threonylcarbamoyladenosine biosynthesis protein TsaB